MKQQHSRILAIDPGTRHVGIAVLDGSHLAYHGVRDLPHRKSQPAIRRQTRLLVEELVRDFRPTTLAIEKNAIGNRVSRSLLRLAVSETERVGRCSGIFIEGLAASTVRKLIAGDGRATKNAVARAVTKLYPALKAYLRQSAKWRTSYHGNMFDAVALGLSVLHVAEHRRRRPRQAPPSGRRRF